MLENMKIGQTKIVAAFDEHKIKQWIKDNPMDAENREDLANWCCEEFNIDDDAQADKIWNWCRELTHLPK